MKEGQISLIDHYDGNVVIKTENFVFVKIIDLYKEKESNYDSHISHLEHALHTEMAKKNKK